ncbi:hypothetical protein [Bilophila wadsworthia]|nr:hypothetical protein [Bilophila wadsworthia]
MIFTWVLMEQPAKPGTTTPARQYLFFRLSDKPIPLDLLKPGDMICYAATPKHVTTDPAQCFVDSLFGQVSADAQAERPRDTWASELFQPPQEQEETETAPQSEMRISEPNGQENHQEEGE